MSNTVHHEELDKYMRDDPNWATWSTGSILAHIHPAQPMHHVREDSLEEHLCLRYALTSLLHKQLPVPILDAPHGDMGTCKPCREALEEERRKFRERFEEDDPYDLSTEADTDSDPDGSKRGARYEFRILIILTNSQ